MLYEPPGTNPYPNYDPDYVTSPWALGFVVAGSGATGGDLAPHPVGLRTRAKNSLSGGIHADISCVWNGGGF